MFGSVSVYAFVSILLFSLSLYCLFFSSVCVTAVVFVVDSVFVFLTVCLCICELMLKSIRRRTSSSRRTGPQPRTGRETGNEHFRILSFADRFSHISSHRFSHSLNEQKFNWSKKNKTIYISITIFCR